MQKIRYALIGLVFAAVMACNFKSPGSRTYPELFKVSHVDLDTILVRGRLRVVTDYNSVNYFVYKGVPVGYQFELLKALCDYMGIVLEIKVSNDKEKNIRDLISGQTDLIATNLSVNPKYNHQIAYTVPHCRSRHVLVQRAFETDPASGRKKYNQIIRSAYDLGGKYIHVLKNSTYADQLYQISSQLTDSIRVTEIPDYDVEQLMQLVAEGEIDYTVCLENLAQVNLGLYSNLDIKTVLSDEMELAWGLRLESKMLKNMINQWLTNFIETGQYQRIYKRYFVNYHPLRMVDLQINAEMGEHNPMYDELIQQLAEGSGFDWRLIVSIIYQESRFDPLAESWAGATGLMQLMPETAKLFGVESITSPEQNIRGGIKFLVWLDARLSAHVANKQERIKFVLASFNVGLGHVLDAMKLAEKYGKNPMVWEGNVDLFLLNKSNPLYYSDPIVKYGYCRGEEPYYYVKQIMQRYTHYQSTIKK